MRTYKFQLKPNKTQFKILYEKSEGGQIPMNFKRNKIIEYSPQEDIPEIKHILETFVFASHEIDNIINANTEGQIEDD